MISLDELKALLESGAIVPSLCSWRVDNGKLYKTWEKRAPQLGDHIRAQFGGSVTAYHHGIYASDSEVIHFSGANSPNVMAGTNNEIISTSLSVFMHGKTGPLEVRVYSAQEKKYLSNPDEIVRRASFRLGEKGYCLPYNNCEHFARYCTFGEHQSEQVDGVCANFLELFGSARCNDCFKAVFAAANHDTDYRELLGACKNVVQLASGDSQLLNELLELAVNAAKGYIDFKESQHAARVAKIERARVESERKQEEAVLHDFLVELDTDKRNLAAVMVYFDETFRKMNQALAGGCLDTFVAGLSGISRVVGKIPRHETLEDVDDAFCRNELRWRGKE